MMPLAELVGWWRSLPASAGRTRVLALDGRSGAGKTTVAAGLAAAAALPDAAVVDLDAICPGWDGLAAAPRLLVEHVLEPLSQGRPAGYPRWDWEADRPAGWHPLEPPELHLLLIEGIGCGAQVCARYLSGLLWLEAPAGLRRDRALARDGDTYAPNWQRWADQEQAYLDAEQPWERADLVLDGAPSPAPATSGTVLVLADRRRG
jgi:Mrp family chromosome partitioning ATPase